MNRSIILVGFVALSLAACDTGRKNSVKRDTAPAAFFAEKAALLKADFRYSPPWWQTAICLPDDWQKTLVSKEGALLYDYPGDYSGFGTKVAVALEGAGEAVLSQSMDDARLPIVETALEDADGNELMRWSALAVVPGEDQNLPIYKKTAPAKYDVPPRGDLLLIRKSAKTKAISLTIQSKQPLDMADLTVFRGRQRFLSMSATWTGIQQVKNGFKITFPARVEELAVYCAAGHEAGDVSLDWAKSQPERAARYWAARDFPYGIIRVPDKAMQNILDACIRNVYQAREIKDGLPKKRGSAFGPDLNRDGSYDFFSSFFSQAILWPGGGEKAAEILYAFANHASPLRAWREEQLPKDAAKEGKLVGDMPRNWASTEFIRLTRNLLVLERGSELHLLEGIPRSWLGPGAVTELKNVATDFGPVSMKIEVAADGLAAKLTVSAPENAALTGIVVHLGAWAAAGKAAIEKKETGLALTIPLVR